jgi:predicted Zn-dependent protease
VHGVGLSKNINQVFYKVMKAFCFLKTQRQAEAMDIINELKQNKPTDPVIAKYLVYVFNEMG